MLHEVLCIQSDSGEPRRRLFSDGYFDLFVWYHEDDSILGFQLCYDKQRDEHAFTWREDLGMTHRRVDDGGRSQRGATSFLVPDGVFDKAAILQEFNERSAEVDAEIVDLIAEKLG